MDIQKEREVLIAEIEQFKEEAMKSYLVSRWAESYVNSDPFGYVFIEGNKPWWMKTQAHQLWCFWQSSKAEAGLRWIDINERMPEQGQKVLIYRPFAHEKPHGDPNIKIATYCGEGVWINSHFEHVITYWMPITSPPEELPFI